MLLDALRLDRSRGKTHFISSLYGSRARIVMKRYAVKFLKGLLTFKNMHADLQVPEIPQAVSWHSLLHCTQRASLKPFRHRVLPQHLQASHRHLLWFVSLRRMVLLMKCIIYIWFSSLQTFYFAKELLIIYFPFFFPAMKLERFRAPYMVSLELVFCIIAMTFLSVKATKKSELF